MAWQTMGSEPMEAHAYTCESRGASVGAPAQRKEGT